MHEKSKTTPNVARAKARKKQRKQAKEEALRAEANRLGMNVFDLKMKKQREAIAENAAIQERQKQEAAAARRRTQEYYNKHPYSCPSYY